jgi:hypothetical protein
LANAQADALSCSLKGWPDGTPSPFGPSSESYGGDGIHPVDYQPKPEISTGRQIINTSPTSGPGATWVLSGGFLMKDFHMRSDAVDVLKHPCALDSTAFEDWAKDHLGQGYSLVREDGAYVDPVTRWAAIAFRAGTMQERERVKAREMAAGINRVYGVGAVQI